MPAQEQSLPASLTTAFEHWSQLWQQASAFGPGALWAAALFRESRQLRKRWFAELTQITDRYLRSPAFLELLRRNLMMAAHPTPLSPLPPIPPR